MDSFFVVTFGCQMNKNDSELIRLSMLESGFAPAPDEQNADIVVFNTCSVRGHAESRALARITIAMAHRKSGRGAVVVAGCMAQRLGRTLRDDGRADMVIGTYRVPETGTLVRRFLEGKGGAVYVEMDGAPLSRIREDHPPQPGAPPWHSWVTITHGCENYCSYCIVPSVRGRLVSFPSASIIARLHSLADAGIREITLLGQNVNQYGQDSGDISFAAILEKAAGVPGIEKINFMTSHPKDFTEEIINAIASSDRISRAIHLPLQSGSDRILTAMNRGYTTGDYFRTLDLIASRLGDFSISTDIIVGFPGETEEEFSATLAAMERADFDDAFMYAYSPRAGTPAAGLRETLTRAEKIERLERLILLQKNISQKRLAGRINREERAILERVSRKSSDMIMGRTYLNHMVVVRGTPDDIGRNIRVRIDRVTGSTLHASRI